MLLDIGVGMALVMLGSFNLAVPIYVFLWTVPNIAGNAIGPLTTVYSPWRPAAVALIVVTFAASYGRRWPKPVGTAFSVLAGVALLSAVAGYFVATNAPYIEMWRQTPIEKVLRASGTEILFWLVPISIYQHVRANTGQATRLVRAVCHAGALYSGLGLLQFAVGYFAGFDLFPITRLDLTTNEILLQSVGTGAMARISSLCGEPRYLGAYTVLWILVTAFFGGSAGLSRWKCRLYCLMFFVTAILTGSRTSVYLIALALSILAVVAVVQGRTREVNRIVLAMALGAAIVGSLIMNEVGSFGYRVIGKANIEEGTVLQNLPIEWQDRVALRVLWSRPWAILLGFGPGLWQYFADPWEDELITFNFREVRAFRLDSLRPNLSILSRTLAYGITGFVAVWVLYRRLYRHALAFAPQRKDYRWAFAIGLLLSLSAPVASELSAHTCFWLAIALFSEPPSTGLSYS
jgi:hypothetical protein